VDTSKFIRYFQQGKNVSKKADLSIIYSFFCYFLQKKIVFLRVVDLQGILSAQNLNKYGKKDELQKRVLDIFRSSDSTLKTKVQKKIEEIISNNNNNSKV
jgi:hypothetical protein